MRAQTVKAILFRLFLCFYANENWSSSTCSRCLHDTGDVQRLVECDGGRDKRCAKCGTLYRDPNAAVNITASAWCFVQHGVWHPLTRDSDYEAAQRSQGWSALPSPSAGTGTGTPKRVPRAAAPAAAPAQASLGPVPVLALAAAYTKPSTGNVSQLRRAEV